LAWDNTALISSFHIQQTHDDLSRQARDEHSRLREADGKQHRALAVFT
jgi:hypothetical protein